MICFWQNISYSLHKSKKKPHTYINCYASNQKGEKVMSKTVTFDSNVWESIVDEQKRENADAVYTKLFELIGTGVIEPYFFEGIATMGTVKKNYRKDYISNYLTFFLQLRYLSRPSIMTSNKSEENFVTDPGRVHI